MSKLQSRLQAQSVPLQSPHVGVRRGGHVRMPILRQEMQAQDAHHLPFGEEAPH